MELYSILGWINFFLVLLSLSYFFIKFIYKKVAFKSKDSKEKFRNFIKFISKIHRVQGIIIIIIASIHAYLIFETIFYWHTGLVLLLAIIFNLIIFLLGQFKIIKKWLTFHKITALIIFVFLLLHIINPWLFG